MRAKWPWLCVTFSLGRFPVSTHAPFHQLREINDLQRNEAIDMQPEKLREESTRYFPAFPRRVHSG